jgi:hypothetical protein
MSNHFSAAMLKFPGDDPRLDLTDLYVFASPWYVVSPAGRAIKHDGGG